MRENGWLVRRKQRKKLYFPVRDVIEQAALMLKQLRSLERRGVRSRTGRGFACLPPAHIEAHRVLSWYCGPSTLSWLESAWRGAAAPRNSGSPQLLLCYTKPGLFGRSRRNGARPESGSSSCVVEGIWPDCGRRRSSKPLHKRLRRYQLGTTWVPHGYQSGTGLG